MPAYIDEHFARSVDAWHPTENPDGYIALCIAENKLVWDLLEPRLRAEREVPEAAVGYDAMVGATTVREQLAAYLGRAFLGRAVDPGHLTLLNGAGSVLEMLFYVLADDGEGVLVPTPSYAGFWADLETRDGLHVVPVHCRSEDGFRLTPQLLDAALDGAGRPVTSLLFTSPNNPLGWVYSAEEIDEVLTWADRRGIHVVMDEIYALSVFGETPFVSAAQVRDDFGDRIHLVWAFSKDFAMSGLRAGVLYSQNADVLEAIDRIAYWAACSGDTQRLLGNMVADSSWVDTFVAENQHRLGEAHRRASGALAAAGIEHFAAEAGFFVLCDLRPFMSEVTWAEEERIWRRLLDSAGVNLTPGSACRVGEPGFFRLCFANQPSEAVEVAVGRITGAL